MHWSLLLMLVESAEVLEVIEIDLIVRAVNSPSVLLWDIRSVDHGHGTDSGSAGKVKHS